jgi:hypothetical protein
MGNLYSLTNSFLIDLGKLVYTSLQIEGLMLSNNVNNLHQLGVYTIYYIAREYGENPFHRNKTNFILINYNEAYTRLPNKITRLNQSELSTLFHHYYGSFPSFTFRRLCRYLQHPLNKMALFFKKPTTYSIHIERKYNTRLTIEEASICFTYNTFNQELAFVYPNLVALLQSDYNKKLNN